MAANNIYIQVDFNSQNAQANANALNKTVADLGPAAENSSKRATKSLESVSVSVQQTSQAFAQFASAIAGLGIERAVQSMIEIGSGLQRAQVAMTAFIGSAAEAAKVMDQVRAVAQQSTFHYKDLAETAQQLAGFGVAAQNIAPMLKVVTDQVTAMGGSIENVNSIVRIFGRVADKDFVSAMDLFRLLPQQGVKVMQALEAELAKARGVAKVSTDDVTEALKSGALNWQQTLNVVLQAMKEGTEGAGARVNDVAKILKNFGDAIDYVKGLLVGPTGFGPALAKLAGEIETVLAPVAGLVKEFMDLPESTKELIVNITAATLAVTAFIGAWTLFLKIVDPIKTAIFDIGAALFKGIVAVLTDPLLLGALATITAAVTAFVLIEPEKAKAMKDSAISWVTDLWQSMKDKIAQLTKEGRGLFEAAMPPPYQPQGTGPITQETPKNLEALQKKVTEAADTANRTLLNAVESPVEAVIVKYADLMDKLQKDIVDKAIDTGHARDLIAQLNAAKQSEMQAKLFEKEKQNIAETAKLKEETVKGSYDAQIAYIEAMDAQDLRSKVANIDKVTQLHMQSARDVAKVQDDALQQQFRAEANIIAQNRGYYASKGVDYQQVILDRQKEMLAKMGVNDQKAFDESQKDRLEGWKKANDVIIEDQKRVFDSFKSMFDDLFDALTGKTSNIGRAVADVFKKIGLGAARDMFSSTAGSLATQAAGYGVPEPSITRGGGIFGALLQRGMPPRPPGPPPDAYAPTTSDSSIKADQLTQTFSGATDKMDIASNSFVLATNQFAVAVAAFGNASQTSATTGSASRSMDDTTAGAIADTMTKASQQYGVPLTILRSVARVESGGNINTPPSPKGAIGIMQLMPSTAAELGVDPNDPTQNIMGAAKYLHQLNQRFHGDWTRTVAAYNAGPGRVGSGSPLPAETSAYVKKVFGPTGSYGGGGGGFYSGPPLAGLSVDSKGIVGYTVDAPMLTGQPATNYVPQGPPAPLGPPPELLNWSVPTTAGLDSLNQLQPLDPGALPVSPMVQQMMQTNQSSGIMSKLMAMGMGALGGGGQGGKGSPLGNLSKLISTGGLKAAFGMGPVTTFQGAYTSSTAKILGSQGVGALAGIAGTMLLSQGLQHRSTALTTGGGALEGLAIGNQMGMTPGAGLMMGAGGGLFMSGMQKGGALGLGMDVAGGALAGAGIGAFAGPMGMAIGAAVGAVVGAVAGTVRLFIKTEQEKIRAQIKQTYGIDISNRQILTQIQQIVDQKYGGNVAVGIHSQDVQDIVRLFALSTGQAANLPRPMYNATITEAGGGMNLQPVYQGGVLVQNPYTGPTTYQYQTAVAQAQGAMPNPGSGLGVPGGAGIINQSWSSLVVSAMQQNPSAVAMAGASAARAGDSRLSVASAMQEPLTALS